MALAEGYVFVSALKLVTALREQRTHELPDRCAVLTLDDGPLFDFESVDYPPYGQQRSMLEIIKSVHKSKFGLKLGVPPVVGTSFVIASDATRKRIATAMGDEHWLTDRWWWSAQRSGYLDIGSHSWNHVHPFSSYAKSRPEMVETFWRVETEEEAELQVIEGSRSVRVRTMHDAARLFAYPYGQYSGYLIAEFLPKQNEVWGAFTTQPEYVHPGTSLWTIPRFVCNDHWRSPSELLSILAA